jgi:hypothetical protein
MIGPLNGASVRLCEPEVALCRGVRAFDFDSEPIRK